MKWEWENPALAPPVNAKHQNRAAKPLAGGQTTKRLHRPIQHNTPLNQRLNDPTADSSRERTWVRQLEMVALAW